MLKRFVGCAALAVMLGLFSSGCGIFDTDVPTEDLQPVPEAIDDPNGGNASLNGNDFNSGNPYGGSGAIGGPGVGEWGEGAEQGSAIGADADGWVPADPTGNRLNMPIIYFAYDSDVLVPSETANLDRIAAYMSDKPELGLLVEGHCDQRGTEEYNRALGERRANAIRAYLAGKGLADTRMKTISYGEDKPAVEGNNEEAWRQNRRGVPVPMRMPRR